MMSVVEEFPPNYAEIREAFPAAAASAAVIFAWGPTIYNPHRIAIDPHLHAHERVHGFVQHPAEGGPGPWWRRYIDDPEFRLAQEVEAYRTQLGSYSALCLDRERRHRYARALAGHLSGPLYGGLIDSNEAYRRLTR
jgi:hypothetical protein